MYVSSNLYLCITLQLNRLSQSWSELVIGSYQNWKFEVWVLTCILWTGHLKTPNQELHILETQGLICLRSDNPGAPGQIQSHSLLTSS